MKNLKIKIRTKSFWMSIISGVVLILQALGVKVDVPYLNEIVGSICSLLVLVGVFTAPLEAENKQTATTKTEDEQLDKVEQDEQNLT